MAELDQTDSGISGRTAWASRVGSSGALFFLSFLFRSLLPRSAHTRLRSLPFTQAIVLNNNGDKAVSQLVSLVQVIPLPSERPHPAHSGIGLYGPLLSNDQRILLTGRKRVDGFSYHHLTLDEPAFADSLGATTPTRLRLGTKQQGQVSLKAAMPSVFAIHRR